jgi:hypothetical protein
MPNSDQPPRPDTPTVHPSEPEQERRLLDSAIEAMGDNSSRRFIGLHSIRDTLVHVGLDVDDNGFIIEKETGEYATPYAYSPDAFRQIESPVDNPLDAYYRPEENVTLCILSKGCVHLSDLHTVNIVDGKPRPVRDDKMPLAEMHRETGMAFSVVTQWSDALDLIDAGDFPGPDVHLNHPGLADHSITLNCLRCEFTGDPDEWDGKEDAPECPDCGGPWDTRGMEICTACQTTHWWEDIDHGGRYGGPNCPECGAGHETLESQTHYTIHTDQQTMSDTDDDDNWPDPRSTATDE